MSLLRSSMVCAVIAVVIAINAPALARAAVAKSWTGSSAMLDEGTLARQATKSESKKSGKDVPAKKTPTKAIRELDAMLDDFKTGKSLTSEEEQHNRELKMKIIHGTFDVRELSRLSLAKHWNSLTTTQRNHFVDLMVSLLEEKALFSKEQSAAKSKQGGKYKVLYKGHKYLSKGKNKSFVRTKVIIPAENIDIDLNYKLKLQDGEWKIYDVIVDEASLVANYKYQFNSIIVKHGYDELVSRMTRKLDEIKTKRE